METNSPQPLEIAAALKEWAVSIRALCEGRQIFLLRKGGILDAGGEFTLESNRVLLFPTYLHEDEQGEALQPCYRQWLGEENKRKPKEGTIRLSAWAEITDAVFVTKPDALYPLRSQHIHSDSFLNYRIDHDKSRPLIALFLRVYELQNPVEIAMEPDYYGCRSWITLKDALAVNRDRPALGNATYDERLRVIKARLTD